MSRFFDNIQQLLKKKKIEGEKQKSIKENLDDEEDILNLYKILSPDFLLKKYSSEDANSLNKNFYYELLHIIGLKEETVKTKIVIKRAKIEGSLIENVIENIEPKLDNIQDIKQYGDNKEEQVFSIALEICLSWINRILFLKLLESQIIAFHKQEEKYKYEFLNPYTENRKIKEFDDLEVLFFKVLSTPYEKRKEHYKNQFQNIPYLNSSLFEYTKLERQTISISGLAEHYPLKLWNKSILKDNRQNDDINLLDYLLRFLHSYDFETEGKNNPLKKESANLINASVLGKIFEKINGYKDGSYFTPAYITEYICSEAIGRAVIERFNQVKKWKCQTLVDVHNKIENIEEANEIVNSIKVCDPAVGSGHFLVSALNEIIRIKSYLGILCDAEEGKVIRDWEVNIQDDELVITNDEGTVFEYSPNSREAHKIQKTLFSEKAKIIENCLFGIDINPKSVDICRLRLWIELLKNTYYKNYNSKADYNDLETLPNIDINIKCGNSLIHKIEIDKKTSELGEYNIKKEINKYKSLIKEYVHESNKDKKRKVENHIGQIKGQLYNAVGQLSLELDESFKNKDKEEIYNNAFEWRIEFPQVLDDKGNFIGFDAVIGNPPYIDSESMVNSKLKNIRFHITETYKMVKGNWDIYIAFFELAYNLIKRNGLFSYITPDKWITKPFGDEFRIQTIGNLYKIVKVGRDVFDEAGIDSILTFFQKEKHKNIDVLTTEKEEVLFFRAVNKNTLKEPYKLDFLFSEYLPILAKVEEIDTNLSDYNMECENACATSDAYKLKGILHNPETIKFNPNIHIKVINTGTIDKYVSKWGTKEMTYLKDKYLHPILQKEEFYKNFTNSYSKKAKKPKIIIKGLTLLEACLDIEGNILPGKSTLVITNDNSDELKFITALINSKLPFFYIKEKYASSSYNGGINFTKGMLNTLPIPKTTKEQQKEFIKIVDQIMLAKQQAPSADTTPLEEKIDNLVYDIYGLTEEEISLIEGKKS